MEDDPVTGVQGDYHVDDSFTVVLGKDVAGFLLKQLFPGACYPYRFDKQFSLLSAFGGEDFLLLNRAHFLAIGGLDRVAVIPKVEVVYVTVIEPNSCVV